MYTETHESDREDRRSVWSGREEKVLYVSGLVCLRSKIVNHQSTGTPSVDWRDLESKE